MTVPRPATAGEVAAIVRDAHDRGRPLRLVGRGTWLEGGAPVRADAAPIDLGAIAGIVEYVPGDLTLTALAGTTLAELDAATAAHGQWCTLLPWGTDEGTLGATFATATAGPCAGRFGAPRDLALGLEFVDGTGTVVRAGGRVVKNVAGFDLTRLLIGAWGTLGVITEVTVRLRARPGVDETWSVAFDPSDAGFREALQRFRHGPLAPVSCEIVHGAAARALGLGDAAALLRLGGNAAYVAAARETLRTLGAAEPAESGLWTRLRALHADRGHVATGDAIADPLSRRVKAQFDPRHILNPGILGEPMQ